MVAFVEEISKALDCELTMLTQGSRYTVYNNRYAVVEGHKGLLGIFETQIVLKGASNGQLIYINGSELAIKSLGRGLVIIEGNIGCIEVKSVER